VKEPQSELEIYSPISGLFAAISFLAIAIMVIYPLQDYDTFWHAANGRAMFATGKIVNSEIYSYITDPNKTFHNHEWLSQGVIYFFFQHWGTTGLLTFKVLISLVICGLLYISMRRQGTSRELASLLCMAAVFAGINRYEVRPHLFSFLGVVCLIYLLGAFKMGTLRGRYLALLPILFTIWNGFHTPVYGLGFLTLFLAGETIKYIYFNKFKPDSSTGFELVEGSGDTPPKGLQTGASLSFGQLKSLWLAAVATVFALLVNPDGLLTYQFVVQLFKGANQMLVTTGEFGPADFTKTFFLFWGLLGLLGVSFLWSRRTIDITSLLLATAFALLAIKFQRAVPVFCLVSMPILAGNLKKFPGRGILSTIPLTSLLLICSFGAIFYWKFIGPPSYYSFGTGISGQLLPVGSARFIKETGLKGNMFNTDRYGGYLAFWLAPERKIFHYNIPAFFNSAQSYFHGASSVIDQWDINYAIVGYKPELDMFRNAGFVPVYWESSAALLVKNIPANKDIIDKYRIRYFRPLLGAPKIRELAADPRSFPALVGELGNYLAFRVDREMADLFGEIILKPSSAISIAEREEVVSGALRYNPESALLQQAFGVLLYQEKRLTEAKEILHRALSLNQALIPARLNLAYIEYDFKNYEYAERQFAKLYKADSENANALYGLALCHFSMGQQEKARDEWRKFLTLVPKGPWADKARGLLSGM
jgi:tetratricopeptide (TPR) repeat protein